MAPIRAVVFDMDGTITRPFLDFPKIREAIGLPEPLLESMMALPSGPERDRAWRTLEEFEAEAAARSELNDSAREILEFLEGRNIPAGLVTRNSRASVRLVLARHSLRFGIVMTRDDAPPKPRPEPLWKICEHFGVTPSSALMVGDFKLDVVAGRAAGLRTALLTNGRDASFLPEAPPDHVLRRLDELRALFGHI